MGLGAAWRALWHVPRETKASAAGPIIALNRIGQPRWTPRRYDAFADEGYRKNVIAYRSINEVARAAASVPWSLFRQAGGDRKAIEDHPLLGLLARPNPIMGHGAFFEALVGYYLIAGNSYIEAVGPDGGAPLELWTLRPDRMLVIPGGFGLPEGFRYLLGGKSKTWEADPLTGAGPILHVKTFNPLDDFYGMSPIEAAAYNIDIRNESDKHNQALLQNDARPSGAMVYAPRDGAPADLTDEQYARLKIAIDEQFSGANTGKAMVIGGGMTWQQMGMKPKDMDFMQAKFSSSRDIALAFGVPPMLLGIPGDNTFANYQEARLALWEETVIPLLRLLRDELNNWLTPTFGDDLTLDIDLDEVPALTIRRQATWERVNGATFLTVNEKRDAVGRGEIEGGDVLLVPATLLPLGAEPEAGEEADEAAGKAALPAGGLDPEQAKERYAEAYGDPESTRANGAAEV